MSFGGDSSSSTSSSNSTTDTTISTVDNRVARDNAAIGGNVSVNPGDINGSLQITTADYGAIKGGTDVALESIKSLSNAIAGTQKETQATIGQAFTLANNARQSETSGAINNFLKYGTVIAIALVAGYVIVKSGGR